MDLGNPMPQTIKPIIGDGMYKPFMVIMGMVDYWFYHMKWGASWSYDLSFPAR